MPPTITKAKAPAAYLRPKGRRQNHEDFVRLSEAPPLDALPRSLLPNRHKRWNPPVMRYGYLADAKTIFEYAEANNLVPDSAQPDSPDEGDDSDPETEPSLVYAAQMICVQLSKELGLQKMKLRVELVAPDSSNNMVFITFLNNYTSSKKIPPEDEVNRVEEVLNTILKCPHGGKWHVDGSDYRWRYRF